MQADSTVRIPLRARDGSVRAYVIVDVDDAEWASRWRWSLVGGYAYRQRTVAGHRQSLYLHRELLGLMLGDGLEADHIDRDRLNCRRANLRILTRATNNQNRGSRRGSTSPHRGVYWRADRGKWRAEIEIDRRRINLGTFDDEAEAAAAARVARRRLMPYAVD